MLCTAPCGTLSLRNAVGCRHVNYWRAIVSYWMSCNRCKKLFDLHTLASGTISNSLKRGYGYCSTECGRAATSEKQKGVPRKKKVRTETLACAECGTVFLASGYHLQRAKKSLPSYCSKACSTLAIGRKSSETMRRTNLKYASARMRLNNPMHKEGVREKVSATLKLIGHSPKIRGGNGRPPTKAEVALHEMFSEFGFESQSIVPTGLRGGYPGHYKIDCGNQKLKIAIEADGASHSTRERKLQDAKKDEFLRGRGWTVFRFSNEQILNGRDHVFVTVLPTILRLKSCTHT